MSTLKLMRRLSSKHSGLPDFSEADSGSRPASNLLEKDVDEIAELAKRRPFTLADIPAYWDAIKNMKGVGLNDRKLLLEKLIVLMSMMKDKSLSLKIQKVVINLLYNDLPHPPSSYLGLLPTRTPALIEGIHQKVKYAYRSTDGSNNNPLFPTLGQAGSPYARSVPTLRMASRATLPDPGLVFDTLLKRDEWKPHPGGMSSLFFAFADLVIHSIFDTDSEDWSINKTSSYLDLSILYGNSDAELDKVRRNDGSGKLWDDTFSDSRLLHMPEASCALLVLLSRNHNFIAERILAINENGNLLPIDHPDLNKPIGAREGDSAETIEKLPKRREAQEHELFNRARLVNCGYFMNIILGDYVGAILGLVRDGTDWRLDPLMTMREMDHDIAPTGEGNVCSLEFNLLYRWHASLSQKDEVWIGNMFTHIFRKPFEEITVSDFKDSIKRMPVRGEPKTWNFGSCKRVDGRFPDDQLARAIHDSTDAVAGAFGARAVPAALRVVEIMSIEQSRSWATCTLNEFRKFLGLRPYSNFKEWNPDSKIYTAAAALYKDIDNLELHVGLQAEETKLPGPGAGLCPGYTISRAILADAVCLTRGDRFMTTEFTPYNLTTWGYHDCQYEKDDGAYGGLLTKLLFRTLPSYFPRGSAYAHFPFLQPIIFKSHLEKNTPGLAEKYNWDRPSPAPAPLPVNEYAAVQTVLSSADFVSAHDQRVFTSAKPALAKESRKSSENQESTSVQAQKALHRGVSNIEKVLFGKFSAEFAVFFAERTKSLIQEHSFKHIGKPIYYIDIIKNVVNLLPVHFVAALAGIPLNWARNLNGTWPEADAVEMFQEISEYVYFNDPASDWKLREYSQTYAKRIVESIKATVEKFDSWNLLGDSNSDTSNPLRGVLKKVWTECGKGQSHREFSAQVFAALVPSAPVFSKAIANAIHLALSSGDIVASEKLGGDRLLALVNETLRTNPPIAGVHRIAAKELDLHGMQVSVGSHVFANVIKANADAKDPLVPFSDTGLMTKAFFDNAVPAILDVILSLKGISETPGKSGSLVRFKETKHGTDVFHYIDAKGLITPFPDALLVQYAA